MVTVLMVTVLMVTVLMVTVFVVAAERLATGLVRYGFLCVAMAVIMIVIVLTIMDVPHAVEAGQDQPVHHGPGRRQNSDDAVGRRRVLIAHPGHSVRADQLIAEPQAGGARDLGSEHRLQTGIPQPAFGETGVVQSWISRRCADDAKPVRAVAQGQRDGLGYSPVLGPALSLGQWDIPSGKVGVVDRGEDELHRTALGPEHQIDPLSVARERLVELMRKQQQHDDGCGAQREKSHVQGAGDGCGAQIRPRKSG